MTSHEDAGQGTQPAAYSTGLPIGSVHASQHELDIDHTPGNTSDQLIGIKTQSYDEVDVDEETWTQISGPCDDEMSGSDDSSVETTVQYQTPRAIRKAEQKSMPRSSDLHTAPEVHRQYISFVFLLCKNTATEDADRYVLEGLPVAIVTARSIQLDEVTTHDNELNVYAFALVIHVWQIVCLRMQHGRLPPAETDQSLCLRFATYFLSAHTIVEQQCTVSSEDLRYAVQYWEDRLRLMGQGNRWMEDQWTENIPQIDQDIVTHRNETADRYLEALERFGKEGLAISIIEEEKKGDCTQLRTMIQQSPDALKDARRQLAAMLYSMETLLLKAIIQGQLPRLAEIGSGPVYQALRELNEQDFIQPGTYMNCICDYAGFSPTPAQWQKVCEQMLRYVQSGGEHNDMAQQIDQRLHPKAEWPKDLAHRGLRRYTEWRSYTEKGSLAPDSVHRSWVKYFVDQLKKRMKGHPVHAPLDVPVIEIGFSNDPRKRLRQHRHHESSNYLMNLAEAIFDMEYPTAFRLQQWIVFACYRSIQTWLSEIVITQLAQGYVEGGAGFSHEPAGRSNTSSHKMVPTKIWTLFEARAHADGRIEKEVSANFHRLQAKKESMDQAKDQRKTEAEAARTVQVARVAHLRNTVALEGARKDLYDALMKRQP